VNLAGVVVVALYAENDAVHYVPQAATDGQPVRRVEAKKVTEIATLHFATG
jgi:hypothetical protein